MRGVLFLQSEVPDPYPHYAMRLAVAAVHHDREAGVHAVYSHAGCKAVLASDAAHVPAAALAGMQGAPLQLARRLVRLANPPEHARLRQVAQQLFASLRPPLVDALVWRLLAEQGAEPDWVAAVCKPLPPLALMQGLGFDAASIAALMPHIASLSTLMLPAKPPALCAALELTVAACWPVLQREAARLTGSEDDAATANLAGLLIQSLDATRGLLSNALLQALRLPVLPATGPQWRMLVDETLRFDPPIQHTRRVLARPMEIEGVSLPQGAQLLLVLAAANRDAAVFAQPDRFDLRRENSNAHLTFGLGAHACLAREYAAQLAALALQSLFGRGPVQLRQACINYVPLGNARLPQELRIACAPATG